MVRGDVIAFTTVVIMTPISFRIGLRRRTKVRKGAEILSGSEGTRKNMSILEDLLPKAYIVIWTRL